jgi:hypothetical protein
MEQKPRNVLPLISMERASKDALEIIEQERDGKQRGLYSRWNNLNRGVLKYFRFGYATLIAGLSGSGKSYIMNMLLDDFTNPELNGGYIHFEDVVCLHFGFEMKASDEIIRNISGKIDVPYSFILSSHYDEALQDYNVLNDSQFEAIKAQIEKLRDRPIHYINEVGTLSQIWDTVNHYKERNRRAKIIVSLDHTLLTKRGTNEKNEIDLIAATGILAMALSKMGCMVVLLGQLNGNIENPLRYQSKTSHYPIRTDIHGSNQLYNAMDNVLIPHRPELLGLATYGRHNLVTSKLVHGCLLKSRFGKAGNLWFREELQKGAIVEVQFDELPKVKNDEKSK